METHPALVQISIFNCEWCGKPLPLGRSHRKTHEGCRQRLFDWRHNQNKRAEAAIAAIQTLAAYLRVDSTQAEAIVQFEQIERVLIECYKQAGLARRNR